MKSQIKSILLYGLLPVVGILLAIWFSYQNSLNGVFLFDDHPNIIDNAGIRQLHPISNHLLSGGTRRLVNLSLAANYSWSELDTFGYHVFNVTVHALASIALFSLVFVTLKSKPFKELSSLSKVGLAWSIATIWAVHPLNTQAVTYIIQRSESMAGLSMFLFLLLYSLGCRFRKPLLFVLAFFVYLAGLLCKETMAMAIPIATILDRAIYSKSWKIAFRRRGLFWGLCILPLLIGVPLVLPSLTAADSTAGFNMHAVSWWEYVRTQPQVWIQYLSLALIPYPQCFDYGWPPETNPLVIVFTGTLVALTIAGLILAFRKNSWWSLWGLAALIVLIPTTLIPLQDLAVEHRMYMSLAFILVPPLAFLWLRTEQVDKLPATFLRFGSVALLLIIYMPLTIGRNEVYHSEIGIWQDTIACVKESGRGSMWSGRAYANLGSALANEGEWKESLEALEIASETRSYPAEVYGNLQGNLVRAHIALGQYDQAEKHLMAALKANPDSARLIQQAGLIAARKQDMPMALKFFRKAAEMAPRDLTIQANLARALALNGQSEEAIEKYQELVDIDSKFAEAYRALIELLIDNHDLPTASTKATDYAKRFPNDSYAFWLTGLVSLLQGNETKALAEWDRVEKNPPSKLYMLKGDTLRKRGDMDGAIAAYRKQIELFPNTLDAWINLGGLAANSDPRRAEHYYQQSLLISPNSLNAKYNLAVVQLKLGKIEPAIVQLNEIVSIDTSFEPAQRLLRLVREKTDATPPSEADNSAKDPSSKLELTPR